MRIKAEMLAAIMRDFPDLPINEIKPMPIRPLSETREKDVAYEVEYIDRENGIVVSIPRLRKKVR